MRGTTKVVVYIVALTLGILYVTKYNGVGQGGQLEGERSTPKIELSKFGDVFMKWG